MIRYALRCDHGHEFDQWFSNMDDYDHRKSALACPECGSGEVEKAIMAPRLGKARQPETMPAPCGAPVCAGGRCAMADFG